jgi:NTE family protein
LHLPEICRITELMLYSRRNGNGNHSPSGNAGSASGSHTAVGPLKATSTIARTLYRELRRADYNHQDVLRVVNEMMELLTADARSPQPEPTRLPPTLDRETGLPNAPIMREVLDFEIGHAREGQGLLVVTLDVELPELTADGVCAEVHETLSGELRRLVRASETVGRIAPGRYLIVLPRASLDVVTPLLRRLGHAFMRLEALRTPGRLRIHGRAAAWSPSVSSAADLLERCAEASPIPVFPPRIRTTTGPVQIVPGDPRVVLALGGGAARAMAHLGVLRVLSRGGIRIAGVAGTSAGAIVGALWAAGLPIEEMIDRFTGFAGSDLYKTMRSSYARHRGRIQASKARERFFRGSSLTFLSDTERSALGEDLLAAFVERLVGPDRLIQSLPLPFAASATDLVAGRQHTMSYGSLHSALRASCAIPGMFPPVADGERLLVDGSVVAEVPIGAAGQLGLKAPVLALHLERAVPEVTRFETSTEIAIRTNALIHTQLVREQLRSAPLLVTIPVAEIGWLSFRDGAKLIAEGERAAEAALPALLERLDGRASMSLPPG